MMQRTRSWESMRVPTAAERVAQFRQRLTMRCDELDRATRYAAGVRVKLAWLRRWNPTATAGQLPIGGPGA